MTATNKKSAAGSAGGPTFPEDELETLRAARAILERHGFESDIGACIEAAEQANVDEAVAVGKSTAHLGAAPERS